MTNHNNYESVGDFKSFYSSRFGRVVRRIVQERIREIWPDIHGLRLMGAGYAVPYLKIFEDEAERIFSIMHDGQGAHQWPSVQGSPNLVCLANESALPVETNSVDRILLIHDVEFSADLSLYLQEIWRVLKSSGRLLVVVPNRSGFWARAERSPFGHGKPYSAFQICNYLRENAFVHERTEEALFVPPLKSSVILKSAGFYERIGRNFLPIVAGIHLVEVSKQLYARSGSGGLGALAGGRRRRGGIFVPSPVSQNI